MFLKPTKEKVLGTLGLLVADWLAGTISGELSKLFIDMEKLKALVPAMTQAFAAVGFMNLIALGILITVVELVLKAAFFYIVLSYVLEKAEPKKK